MPFVRERWEKVWESDDDPAQMWILVFKYTHEWVEHLQAPQNHSQVTTSDWISLLHSTQINTFITSQCFSALFYLTVDISGINWSIKSFRIAAPLALWSCNILHHIFGQRSSRTVWQQHCEENKITTLPAQSYHLWHDQTFYVQLLVESCIWTLFRSHWRGGLNPVQTFLSQKYQNRQITAGHCTKYCAMGGHCIPMLPLSNMPGNNVHPCLPANAGWVICF